MKLSIATLTAVVATASAFAPSPAFKSCKYGEMVKMKVPCQLIGMCCAVVLCEQSDD